MLLHLVMSIPETMEDILVLSRELSSLDLSICKVTFHIISLEIICYVILFLKAFSYLQMFSTPFSEDPWSSSGYSAMLGNSPHIGQPGSFSAINPQDRMVSRNYLNPILTFLLLVFSLFHVRYLCILFFLLSFIMVYIF